VKPQKTKEGDSSTRVPIFNYEKVNGEKYQIFRIEEQIELYLMEYRNGSAYVSSKHEEAHIFLKHYSGFLPVYRS